MVTPGYRFFGNQGWPTVSLTGGTQFVNVNQLFTKTLADAKFCKVFKLQRAYSQALIAVPVGIGLKSILHSQDGKRSPKIRCSEQVFRQLKSLNSRP